MIKPAAVAAGTALAVLAVFLAGAQVLGPVTVQPTLDRDATNAFQRTITVSGEGTVTAKPDSLQAELGVVTVRPALPESIQENNEKMAAVIAALKELGLADKDIQTARLQIDVERAPYNGPITGYRVSNRVRITIRDLARAGEILDRSVEAGVNDLYGVWFATGDAKQLEQQARLAAVADALSKAREMVEAAGGRLGQVLTISATNEYRPRYSDFYTLSAPVAERAAVPIEAGELELRVTVQVVFEIE
jgi:uncharacterized protein YggE